MGASQGFVLELGVLRSLGNRALERFDQLDTIVLSATRACRAMRCSYARSHHLFQERST